ncbi:MAG: alpha-galactosidase [Anaerolineae bacterium]
MPKPLPTTSTPGDMALQRELCERLFAAPQSLPISYTYDGVEHHGMPQDASVQQRLVDANIVETVYTAQLGDLQIRAECQTFRDFPVLEWTVYFANVGSHNTALLADVSAIDTTFAGTNPVLVHNNGDFYSADGYTVARTTLTQDTIFAQAPAGGRPCDHAFPYQRVLCDDFGLNISIGWPGQWSCAYRGAAEGFALKAGQETVHTYLQPGECLRTPRMTVMAFLGDETRGVNLWRRWFNAHVTPRQFGAILRPRAVVSNNAGGIEFTKADEANQLECIRYVKDNLPEANLWWIDAGWYPCLEDDGTPNWPKTGTWTPDPARFPNGLKPVGVACQEAGLELLVWFEPERVRAGTWLAQEHPEWLLRVQQAQPGIDPQNAMLNLANPDCHRWLRETFAAFLRDNHISCYRQDFNFAPLLYWRDNEAEDRKGLLENQYVQGYLAFWDYLLLNVPNLWIDSCSSGGRRNDLETMRRSVPLHPTDYGYGYHHINQAFRHTLCAWIPYVRSWAQSWDKDNAYYKHDDYYAPEEVSFDNYKMINGFGSLTTIGRVPEIQAAKEQLPYLRSLLRIWQRFADLQLRGDFYPLTENHRDNTRWTVFQFHLPEQSEGAFQVLRNNQSEEESLTLMPAGICPYEKYLFENPESGESLVRSGAEIHRDGLTFRQPVRSGAIWFYRKQ